MSGRYSELQNLIDKKCVSSVYHVPLDSGLSEVVDMQQTYDLEEIGGRGGLDPVRYGDWEKNGRCIDF
ncbi:hypothetical protein AF72_10245 [Xylella taiwanensis]|uniref:DUF1674 domain-containing protein n=3 Tax=Xylella taiwanensis TaxID=1444770 RepID=Z9JHU0_9GAMM|nr:hypothetical protein AF72_10245 [Xylella taiwanensis]